MPLTEADQKRVEAFEAELAASESSRIAVRVPGESQKLGVTTVACLIFNRTIGENSYFNTLVNVYEFALRFPTRCWHLRKPSSRPKGD